MALLHCCRYGRAEAALLSSLRHPYVLAFFGCCVHERLLYIVTELCDTTLKELISKRFVRERLALEPQGLQARWMCRAKSMNSHSVA